ncbi:MAG: hypothetical protein KC996_06290 [Phycisphaerales bacterium]|nr:hypothetical protein [Phycisphaerales bacterium]
MLPIVISSVLVASAPVPGVSAVGERIDSLLVEMEDAIARKDAGAYMALVDTTDSVWATEQRAWVSDLSVNPVEDVTVSRVWDSTIELTESGDAVTTIDIVWYVPGEELDRSFTFDAVFRPVGLADGRWVYGGRAWRETHDEVDGVVVCGDGQFDGLDDRIAGRVPALKAGVEALMGVTLDADIVVKVYPDVSSLQASIALSYTDPLSGWNEPGESIKILGRDGLDGEGLDTLLAHEIGHAVSFAMGEQIINAPWWVLEGIAEVSADLYREDTDGRMNRIVKLASEDDLRDWSQLADFRGEANNHAMHVYLQGWSMVHHVSAFYGEEKRNAWLAAMGQGKTLDEATRDAMGISFASLDRQWRAMLDARVAQLPDESE